MKLHACNRDSIGEKSSLLDTAIQAIIPYRTDGGIAKLSCNGVSLTRDGKWVLPIWREIGGGAPCQQVSKSTKALHGVASVLISDDQVRPP